MIWPTARSTCDGSTGSSSHAMSVDASHCCAVAWS